MRQPKLTFKLLTDEKLSIKSYTETLLALNDEYNSFSGDRKELTIAKVGDGGYSIDFVLNKGQLSLIDDTDSYLFADFISYLGGVVNHLLSKDSVSSLDVNAHKLDTLNNTEIIIKSIKKKGSISISSGEDKLIISKSMIDTMQSNLPKGKLNAQIIEEGETVTKLYSKKIFFWFQTRFDKGDINTGNLGVIESISKKGIKVIFDDNDIETKKQMTSISGDTNWQERGYIVDVEVISRKNRIVAYRIIHNYHEEYVVDRDINLFTYQFAE